MILCQKCGNDNPMGTVYCRRCGERITVGAMQLQHAIGTARRDEGDVRLLGSAHTALGFAIFALLSALTLRFALVPPLPPGELQPPELVRLFPEEAPPSAADSSLPPQPARILWRRGPGKAIIDAFGLDPRQLAQRQALIMARQLADGSFPGGDPRAATALAALALQVWPQDDAVALAAHRARAWLLGRNRDLAKLSPLARSLGALALADCGQLDEPARSALGVYLVDGKAGVWQALTWMSLPAPARPRQLAALRQGLPEGPWRWLFASLSDGDPAAEGWALASMFSEYAKRLAGAEARLGWSLCAWQSGLAPNDLIEMQRNWSGEAAPAPCDPSLMIACGDLAPLAVQILTACAPILNPALAVESPR